MRKLPALLLASAMYTSWRASPGRAATPPPVRVSIPACLSTPFPVAPFLSSLEVELAGHGPPCCAVVAAPTPDAPGPEVDLAIVPCDQTATAVDVNVSDPPQPLAHRRVELTDIAPDVRARAVALAAAELLRTLSWARNVAPPPVAAPAAPETPPPIGPPPRRRRLLVSGLVSLEDHPGHDMFLLGFRPSVAYAGERWLASFGLEWSATKSTLAIGSVNTTLLAATLGAGPRFSIDRIEVDLSACGRIGAARLEGSPADSTTTKGGSGVGAIVSVGGRLGIAWPTTAEVSQVRAMAEVGTMLHGFDAEINGSTPVGVAGPYLLVGVGVGFGLSPTRTTNGPPTPTDVDTTDPDRR